MKNPFIDIIVPRDGDRVQVVMNTLRKFVIRKPGTEEVSVMTVLPPDKAVELGLKLQEAAAKAGHHQRSKSSSVIDPTQ